MMTDPRLTPITNAILAVLKKEITVDVPPFFAGRALAAAPALAAECAIAALHAITPST